MSTTPNPLRICFVCTGNICRSPMGEILLQDALAEHDLVEYAAVSSCGLGGWHVGDLPDHRALAELRSAGHDGTRTRAKQIDQRDLDADLLIALDTGHRSELLSLGVPSDRIRLLRSFDPEAPTDSSVADPYYGTEKDFHTTRLQIEAALPGILDWVRSTANVEH